MAYQSMFDIISLSCLNSYFQYFNSLFHHHQHLTSLKFVASQWPTFDPQLASFFLIVGESLGLIFPFRTLPFDHMPVRARNTTLNTRNLFNTREFDIISNNFLIPIFLPAAKPNLSAKYDKKKAQHQLVRIYQFSILPANFVGRLFSFFLSYLNNVEVWCNGVVGHFSSCDVLLEKTDASRMTLVTKSNNVMLCRSVFAQCVQMIEVKSNRPSNLKMVKYASPPGFGMMFDFLTLLLFFPFFYCEIIILIRR
jgi:hypothetical protein